MDLLVALQELDLELVQKARQESRVTFVPKELPASSEPAAAASAPVADSSGPVADASRLPEAAVLDAEIDKLQTKMFAFVCPVVRLPGDDAAEYVHCTDKWLAFAEDGSYFADKWLYFVDEYSVFFLK